MFLIPFCLAALSLIGWLYLAFAHGQFWVPLPFEPSAFPGGALNGAWPSVDIIVPARDEAEMLPQTLPDLLAQEYPGAWRVILVDDHSTDGTAAVAQKLSTEPGRLHVVSAPTLPAGWRGKVAAMQAGVAVSDAAFILFTDADIRHPTDSLRRLVARAEAQQLDMASLMVRLNCESLAEKLLIPAFVYFFGMLFPFRKANQPKSFVAAAAGGTMLLRRVSLDRAGGLSRIRAALIDDCALARIVKDYGGELSANGRTELSLATDVVSLRSYPAFPDVWGMVARTAFTQLKHSPGLLLGCVLGMGLLFILPPLLMLCAGGVAAGLAAVTCAIMTLTYLPMVVFYRQHPALALTLPLAALIYICATIDSARLYWQGSGGQWKGRVQA